LKFFDPGGASAAPAEAIAATIARQAAMAG
jgi:hypothetical protein